MGCSGALAKGETILCTKCISDLPTSGYHLVRDNPIETRLVGRIPFTFASAFLKFRKEGIVQKLLHELKYNNHPEVGVMLGRVYGDELARSGMQGFDMIVPVPLHSSRLKQRGYNQSEAFANGLAGSMRIPCRPDVARRRARTTTQTEKARAERWENVRDVFEVNRMKVVGQRILLVDDVMTTGATLEACAGPLVEGGCRELSIVCIAEAQ